MLSFLNEVSFAIFNCSYHYSASASIYVVTLAENWPVLSRPEPNYEAHLAYFKPAADWFTENVVSHVDSHPYLKTLIEQYLTATVIFNIVAFFLVILLFAFIILRGLLAAGLASLMLYISEQEFATPRALALLFCIVGFSIAATAGASALGISITALQALYISAIAALLFLVALLPINLIYNWGAYFTTYVKGQSIKKNIFFELLTDYIHILSFFLRINIQLIRLVIITCVFYMYNEMYVEFIYPTLNASVRGTDLVDYIYAGALFGLKLAGNLLYEVGHLWIMVGMQSGAFVMIIFIITQFLYSVYLIDRMQAFFSALRSSKKGS